MMWNGLKKFGLAHCDLPTMLWNVSVTLRPSGVTIYRRNKRIPIVIYIITGLICTSYLFVYGVSNMWFVFWRCRETKDLKTATIFLSIQLASEIGPLRMLFMLYHKTNIIYIVEKYLEYDESIESGRTGGTLLTHLRTIKKRALTSWVIIVGNCLSYLVKPLFLPGKRLVQDDQVLLGLEPVFESPNYDLAYLLVSGGITFVAYTSSHTTAFFIILIGYTESQLLSMCDSLTCLWDDAQRFCDTHRKRIGFNKVGYSNIEDEDIKSKLMNQFVKKRLNKIIKHHTINKDLIKQIDVTFRGCLVVEYVLVAAALLSELLGGLENTYMELPFTLLMVSVNCFMGQKIINASESFCQAVYGCRWENFDVDNMKTILTILTNSQNYLALTMGGIKVLNFVYLGSIIQSIYSAFTTLNSVMK
nr:odorant receptor 35 [Achelura yunnanensis]